MKFLVLQLEEFHGLTPLRILFRWSNHKQLISVFSLSVIIYLKVFCICTSLFDGPFKISKKRNWETLNRWNGGNRSSPKTSATEVGSLYRRRWFLLGPECQLEPFFMAMPFRSLSAFLTASNGSNSVVNNTKLSRKDWTILLGLIGSQ